MPKGTRKRVSHISREVDKLPVDPKTKAEVMELISEATPQREQASGPPKPGSHSPNRMGKTPWSLRQCEEIFGIEEGIPEDTIKITWNGIMRQFIADYEQSHPKCHWNIYREWRRKARGRQTNIRLSKMGIEKGEYPGSLV